MKGVYMEKHNTPYFDDVDYYCDDTYEAFYQAEIERQEAEHIEMEEQAEIEKQEAKHIEMEEQEEIEKHDTPYFDDVDYFCDDTYEAFYQAEIERQEAEHIETEEQAERERQEASHSQIEKSENSIDDSDKNQRIDWDALSKFNHPLIKTICELNTKINSDGIRMKHWDILVQQLEKTISNATKVDSLMNLIKEKSPETQRAFHVLAAQRATRGYEHER